MLHTFIRGIEIAFLLIVLSCGSTVNAGRLKPQDLRNLPDICKYTWDGLYRDRYDEGVDYFPKYKGDPRYGKLYKYYEVLGKDIIHMHHYCRGLKEINDAIGNCKNSKCREYKFNRAISEFDYVLKNTSAKFVMRSHVLLEKGKVFFYLGKNIEALKVINGAIRINPKYDLAYLQYSRICNSLGERKTAIKTLEKGLKQVPNSMLLKRELKRLGKQ